MRLAKLQADYNAEQECKAKLQEDIAALRSSCQSQVPRLEKAPASRGGPVPKNGNRTASPQCNYSFHIGFCARRPFNKLW